MTKKKKKIAAKRFCWSLQIKEKDDEKQRKTVTQNCFCSLLIKREECDEKDDKKLENNDEENNHVM